MTTHTTWTKLGEREGYSGFVRVRVDTYRGGSGAVGDWDVLEQQDCVCVLAFTVAGTALVFEQFRVGPARVLAELPGGLIDPGEEPAAAGLRELREETGYAAGEHWYAGSEWVAASATRREHAVVAVDCTRVGEPQWDAAESGVVRELSLDQLLIAIRAGSFTDAGSAARALLAFAVADVPSGLLPLRERVRRRLLAP